MPFTPYRLRSPSAPVPLCPRRDVGAVPEDLVVVAGRPHLRTTPAAAAPPATKPRPRPRARHRPAPSPPSHRVDCTAVPSAPAALPHPLKPLCRRSFPTRPVPPVEPTPALAASLRARACHDDDALGRLAPAFLAPVVLLGRLDLWRPPPVRLGLAERPARQAAREPAGQGRPRQRPPALDRPRPRPLRARRPRPRLAHRRASPLVSFFPSVPICGPSDGCQGAGLAGAGREERASWAARARPGIGSRPSGSCRAAYGQSSRRGETDRRCRLQGSLEGRAR